MGGMIRTVFGGSKSKQKSESSSSSTSKQGSFNEAYPMLSEAYQPAIAQGNQASGAITALLGLGGDKAAADAAYGDYLGSTDYKRTLGTGTAAITNNAATAGLLNSGATLKRLQGYGQETAQKYFGDYLARLLGMVEAGQGAARTVAGAGNVSFGDSSSQSKGMSSGTATSYSGDFGKFLFPSPTGG